MAHPPVTLKAPAKINLFLEIVRRREDGYHELRTLFHPVRDLYDSLALHPDDSGALHLSCPNHPDLESETNILAKAWTAFREATGFGPGLAVTLLKRIPMGAGLGGGSTDCAALLAWLNENAGERALDRDSLMGLAARLGADVPFFLMDGPAWAEGIGERLTPATEDFSGLTLVLASPDIHVSSAWAYRAWDEAARSLTTPARHTKNPSPVGPVQVKNDFEQVVFPVYPMLRKLKEFFIFSGACATAMSGSGASVFGLYKDAARAANAAKELRADGISVHVEDMGPDSAGA